VFERFFSTTTYTAILSLGVFKPAPIKALLCLCFFPTMAVKKLTTRFAGGRWLATRLWEAVKKALQTLFFSVLALSLIGCFQSGYVARNYTRSD